MKTRGSRIEDGGRNARSVLEATSPQGFDAPRCGGNPESFRGTPLWLGLRGVDQFGKSAVAVVALPAQSKTWRLALLLCFIILHSSFCLRAWGQSYSIDWHTTDGGGGTSTGGVYSVTGTIGQPDAGGPMTNGQYSVTGGFWAFAAAVQTPGAPLLSIVTSGPGQATISWSPATPGFVLQENSSLSTTNWVNSPSGATNPIVVPAALPTKFYRLHKP